MRKFITPLLMAALLLMSCNVDDPLPKDKPKDKNTAQDVHTIFEKERQSWLKQDVPDYSFYLEYTGQRNMIWKGTIAVKDKMVLGFVTQYCTFADVVDVNGLPWFMYGLSWIDTITGIYATAFNRHQEALEIETTINVEYDRTFHFPQHYCQDIIGNSVAGIISSHEEFWITDFTINPNYSDMPLRTKEIKHLLAYDIKESLEYSRQEWQRQDVRDYSFHLEYISPEGKVWKGTVTVNDDAVSGSVPGESTLNDGYELPWLDTVTGIYAALFNTYQAILDDVPEKFSLRTEIQFEYDWLGFNFPRRYKRYTRLIIPTGTPANQIPDITEFSEEFWITDFVQL